MRLAAIWALGRLRDDGAKDAIATALRLARPSAPLGAPMAEGDGAVRLISDAEGRLFDTALQALGRIAPSEVDPTILRAVSEARQRVEEGELDRPARLPAAEVPSPLAPPTLRTLFEVALPGMGEEDELGC